MHKFNIIFYTILRTTADFRAVQQIVIDGLEKDGKPQRISLKKLGGRTKCSKKKETTGLTGTLTVSSRA